MGATRPGRQLPQVVPQPESMGSPQLGQGISRGVACGFASDRTRRRRDVRARGSRARRPSRHRRAGATGGGDRRRLAAAADDFLEFFEHVPTQVIISSAFLAVKRAPAVFTSMIAQARNVAAAARRGGPPGEKRRASPRSQRPRTGNSIVVAGQAFEVGRPVVLWRDPEGFDAYQTRCIDQSGGCCDGESKRYGVAQGRRARKPGGAAGGHLAARAPLRRLRQLSLLLQVDAQPSPAERKRVRALGALHDRCRRHHLPDARPRRARLPRRGGQLRLDRRRDLQPGAGRSERMAQAPAGLPDARHARGDDQRRAARGLRIPARAVRVDHRAHANAAAAVSQDQADDPRAGRPADHGHAARSAGLLGNSGSPAHREEEVGSGRARLAATSCGR